MKSFCISSLVLAGVFSSSGADSSLANRWDIQGPEFDHIGLQFGLDFVVNDELPEDQIGYTLYDGPGCQDGATVLAKDNNFIDSSMDVTKSLDEEGSKKHAKISFEVKPDAIADSSIYTVIDDSHVQLELCVRFSLYTGHATNAESIEVNFLETILKLHATIESGFSIDSLENVQ